MTARGTDISLILLVLEWSPLLAATQRPDEPVTVGPAQIVDFNDPTYGARVRQLRKDDGHEHNFYYYRDPWNADGSRMLGIQSDLQQQNWHVCLYDGDGVFLKDLFPISQYDWRLCWDRNDPNVLYTRKGSDLFRFTVVTGEAELLKSFSPLEAGNPVRGSASLSVSACGLFLGDSHQLRYDPMDRAGSVSPGSSGTRGLAWPMTFRRAPGLSG